MSKKSNLTIKLLIFFLAIFLVLNYICNKSSKKGETTYYSTFAEIKERGLINAFNEGLKNEDGKTVYCETSAIVYDGTNLIFASDKPIPDLPNKKRSSVFYTNFSNLTAPVEYYTSTIFVETIKYEDFTITPDGNFIIATTGFDRIKSNSSEWDNYNTLMFWPVRQPDAVKVVSPSEVAGVTSSVFLRQKISAALKTNQFPCGVPYFKIEGLASIPENKLLLGVREMGKSYKVFDYSIKMISVSYEIRSDELVLSDDFNLIYNYDHDKKNSELGHEIALSSIEYDKYNDCLYLLTSYEDKTENEVTDEHVGAFLWILSIDNLSANEAPELVLKKFDSKPLLFAHKGEGVTVINKTRIVVVHDDDRVLGREIITDPETQFFRKSHQGAYTVVDFVK